MLDFKNSRQIAIELAVSPLRDRILLAFALSRIARDARYIRDYRAQERWATAIVPSAEGQEVIARANLSDLPAPELHMALFGLFSHTGLLFDPEACDLDALRQLVESDLFAQRARLPYVFDRTLYDRFHELHPAGPIDKLTPEQTSELLDKTPIGISQIGHVLVGPLGILDSEGIRELFPESHVLSLWHAYREGRVAPHNVRLDIFSELPLVRAYEGLQFAALASGSDSEWAPGLMRSILGRSDSPARIYSGMPTLLGQCLAPEELKALTVYVLSTSEGAKLRNALAKPPRKQSFAVGKAEEVATRMSPPEMIQLLLILSDLALAKHIDDACQAKVLGLHAHEVRSPSHTHNALPFSFLRSHGIELGSRGVRDDIGNNTARLATALFEGYSRAGMLSDLAWKVRSQNVESVFGRLLDVVAERGPRWAVHELAFSARKVLDVILDLLQIRGLSFTDDADLEARILWKCGFDMPLPDEPIRLLIERFAEFREITSGTASLDAEESRGRLRSAGVNLFVSVEEFLETLISYLAWLLNSDPHKPEGLQYSADVARAGVPGWLGPPQSGEDPRPWDVGGQNTLGTMLSYLAELNLWIQSTLGSPPDDGLRRPDHEIPIYREYPGRRFGFPYRKLWANCDPQSVSVFKARIADFSSAISRADVAGVRNGLDHKRSKDTFPSLDKLATFVVNFERALGIADNFRLYPKELFVERHTVDRYENTIYELTDARKARIEVREPATVQGLRRREILTGAGPVLVAPEGILGDAHLVLCIKVLRDSSWQRHWAGVPRVRLLGDADTSEECEARSEAIDSRDASSPSLVEGGGALVRAGNAP